MKNLLFLALLVPKFVVAAACCGGTGPRAFIKLQRLQDYEVGVSTSFKDIFGRYNNLSQLEGLPSDQTMTIQLGAGKRINRDTDGFFIVPLVYRQTMQSGNWATRSGMGDISVGINYWLIESLFVSDPYPSMRLQVGVKLPTGSPAGFAGGSEYRPDTGSGYWEPSAGFVFEKQLGNLNVLSAMVYALPLPIGGAKSGDTVELSVSGTYAASRRLNVSAGAHDRIQLQGLKSGQPIADSEGNALKVSLGTSVFFTQVWSVSFGLEASIWGKNQAAEQGIALTSRYGFF